MKKKLLRAALLSLALTLLLSTVAWADMGPKPSVRVSFTGLGDRLCYATLLSETKSTGPASVWNGDPADAYHKGNEEWADLDEATWQAFVDYEDPDGYHFLQWGWPVSDTDGLAWTYYPPDRFKVLLYFPEDGTFVSSDVLERYAFHSYFAADVTAGALIPEKDQAASDAASAAVQVEPHYDYATDLLSLAGRIVLTLAIELGLALVFSFRHRKQFRLIALTNVATQVLLNVILYIVAYRSGYLAFVALYILLELLVFIMEAFIFTLCLNRCGGPQRHRLLIVFYALCANALSFALGMVLATALPGLF